MQLTVVSYHHSSCRWWRVERSLSSSVLLRPAQTNTDRTGRTERFICETAESLMAQRHSKSFQTETHTGKWSPLDTVFVLLYNFISDVCRETWTGKRQPQHPGNREQCPKKNNNNKKHLATIVDNRNHSKHLSNSTVTSEITENTLATA